ncbi:NAD(P)-dependent alcohol dehydrogenase [Albibacterium indicum]|uniref:NAD(P)-dependent alcohol dehydrogenase n=1 Tax=Albibacterium indicum TaxID=2292082 RepID=UPI000E542309|nr:NAD(P)-dependent alcohol dehydrogenase [Pedobacter indicus]
MKTAIYKRYGGPEVVSLQETLKPQPKDNEILIKVYASSVNRTDCGFRGADYFISRLFSGLLAPKLKVLGCEFAGKIEAIGKAVTEFNVGDRVFGYDDSNFGGHAEYKVIDAGAAVTTLPLPLSYAEGAALTEGSHYALGNIRAAGVKPGDFVLVYGATGAIGSAAVQLLKHIGTYVVAVSNTKNTRLIESLGADEVIDYMKQDFTKTTLRFDFIFDAVGKSSFGQCKPLMKDKGVYISTELGQGWENILLAMLAPFKRGKRVLFPIPTTKKEDIIYLRQLAENNIFKPVIDREYPLDEIVEAHRYVETGQKTGNVIIKIA